MIFFSPKLHIIVIIAAMGIAFFLPPVGVGLTIAAGIARVVVGATDPNPAHAGRGFEVLRAAGVEVTTGVLERECTDLNLIFNHWITSGGPRPTDSVYSSTPLASTVKWAMACS